LLGLVPHRLQDRGEQTDGGAFTVTEQDRLLVDTTFRVRLIARRVHQRHPLRVAPDVQPASIVAVHTGPQDRLPVEEQRSGTSIRPPQYGNRVRRTKIDADRVPVSARHRLRPSSRPGPPHTAYLYTKRSIPHCSAIPWVLARSARRSRSPRPRTSNTPSP